MRAFSYLLLLILLGCGLKASSRDQFFNLTATDVKIDSVLPHFSHSFELEDRFADSIYTVSILYPEFIDMTSGDIALYQHISGIPLPELPITNQHLALNRKKGSLEVDFCPLVFRNNRYQILVSFMLQIESHPLLTRQPKNSIETRAGGETSRYAEHSVLANGKWAKIRIPETGVYQLTDALIRKAGFTDLSKVKIYGYGGRLQNEQLVPEELIATDDLKEVSTCLIDGKRLFYGYGPVSWDSNTSTRRTRNPYSTHGYYFITQSADNPQVVDSTTFLHSFYPSPDFYHTLYETDGYSWYHGGRNLFDPVAINVGSSKTFDISSNAKLGAARMSVNVSAGANSSILVTHNGVDKGTLNVMLNEYDKGNEARTAYNIIRSKPIDEVKISTVSGSPSRLDYISFIWNEPLPAPQLQKASFPEPEYVQSITNQDLHADGFADMIIIIPTGLKLKAQAERLKAFHEQHDGMRVRIVPADELYNEFSSGTPDANAYRRYLKMLYDRAGSRDEDMPKYLLLFGDCVWDNRMLTQDCKTLNPNDYLLSYESENSFNEIHCYVDDGFFCSLDDNEGMNVSFSDKQDIAVGRFPVTTDAQAKVMVDKVINYVTNKQAGAWQNTLVFMGDDGNNNLHMRDINATADKISNEYPGYLIKKIMWDAYIRETSSTGNSYPEVERLIKQQQNDGALIMDYGGHGSEIQISHEAVLRITDFEAFNNVHLPLWITASCDIMPFDGTVPTIGETAVLNPKGGALAFFGTTRTVYAYYNALINTAYLHYVLSKDAKGKPVTIGEAQRLAKNNLIISGQDLTDNKLQYSLLGDPAVALHVPTLQVVVDSINGTSVSPTQLIGLRSGEIAKISGHIENSSAFNGIITATVRDSKQLIVGRMNDPIETPTAFSFSDRPKTLYSGSNKVVNGKFQLSFAVPLDINYTDGTGLVNLYAVSDDDQQLANGSNDRFTIGGSEKISNDSIGPSIYCYLNSPSFVNGGEVNSTPYFVAQINDANGINASGNGIGHDLQLIVDGDMSKTYVLNGNFAYDFGSYTSGMTNYNLPELTPGPHKLTFKAWDILNNSSTAELAFNVVHGLEPQLFSVSCTNNPARTNTTFIINHDRNGGLIDCEIDIFDLSGRSLWHHQESGVSTGNAYTVDWNLTSDGGERLQTGVYLYRVRISSDGSSKVSKAHKLIVVGNN